jgi:hypothetical protein
MRTYVAVILALLVLSGCVGSPPPSEPWRYYFHAPIAESQCERYGVSRNTPNWGRCVRRNHYARTTGIR